MKREAAFTTVFQRWLRANPLRTPACFEIKQTRRDSIPFSALEEHQLDALAAAWGAEGISHKISDESRGFKPFDLVYFRYAAAFVVLKFPGFFVLITASRWGTEEKTSQRKSLTADRAKEIAEFVVPL